MAGGTSKGASHQLWFPPETAVDFDHTAFEQAICDKGVILEHWMACPCPLGMVDVGGYRKPHLDHGGCSGGFLFQKKGTVSALFIGNSLQLQQQDIGLLFGSTVNVVFNSYYESEGQEPEPFFIATFDRLYISDQAVLVTNTEMFSPSGASQDRLHFPIAKVIRLLDANGEEYLEARGDFSVIDGKLEWRKKRPIFNSETNKGAICSIRYLYKPYWICKTLLHEIRISQSENFAGDRVLTRLPQGALLQRENVYESEAHDSDAKSSDRQVKGPSTFNLGPR